MRRKLFVICIVIFVFITIVSCNDKDKDFEINKSHLENVAKENSKTKENPISRAERALERNEPGLRLEQETTKAENSKPEYTDTDKTQNKTEKTNPTKAKSTKVNSTKAKSTKAKPTKTNSSITNPIKTEVTEAVKKVDIPVNIPDPQLVYEIDSEKKK